MTKMVYFLLFSIARTIVVSKFDKKRQSRETTSDPSCNYEEKDNVVTCTRPPTDEYIIPENIHRNVTKFNLWNSNPNSTLVKTIDTFKRFPNLTYLFIEGYLKLTNELLVEPTTKQKLCEQFLHLSILKELHMKRCGFVTWSNSEIKDCCFLLPAHISQFTSEDCNDQYFNWKKTMTLKKLIIQNADIKKVPDLGYPSLEELDLSYSPAIFVSAKTLAGFCNLTKYKFTSTIYNEKENYCECTLLRDWFKLLTQINFLVSIESTIVNLNCFPQVGNIDCSNYVLDDLKTIRNNCLSLKPPVSGRTGNVPVEPKKTAPFSLNNIPFWVYTMLIILLIASVYTIIIFSADNWMLGGPIDDQYEEEDYEIEEWLQ